MNSVFITGANRGIGLGLVRHYLEAGWQVHACARKIDNNELADLAKVNTALKLHALDVTDHAGIDALAKTMTADSLDVVIANAGIYGGDKQNLGSIDYAAWRETLEVNTLAPMKIAEAFSGKLKRGGKVAMTSSLMGSITDASSGHYIYRSSKTALNMVAHLLAADLKAKDIAVVTLHPGWVQTDMGGEGAPVTIADSALGLARVINGLTLAQSGSFYDYQGKELPW